ncbi:MAG: Fur family transcriptional regulator [Dehalococcoides mccartyi]|jgi:Fur family ferric uptake transcriptional regulator|uniref:fur family transcriptional regulator n=2 Tax=root TaxID=1 RepID=A0A0V8LXY1_9CHLR|nr:MULTISPECIES: Fur family transcriptional regulator [Dehalococcoides]AHB12808.1 FUR family transcriptional regulator [Dehalococcoides mccartyi GY50]AII57242.1 Fur family transcriptional regulator [Dehalococcoides mccartyi CG1]APH11772.1 Fur family transcriptional regulator [Dehalococcoides mccartyi]KSV16288.1 Fur family transcriptional regulator [Dehalococcoides mccartyi]MDP4279630.1 Fur family transcriptional regulator [Dehalococcoides mccartyi]
MHKQNSIAGELANDGFRLTPQRVLILEALDMAEGHMSAEDIYAEVGQEYPNINISTVYRTLELLKGQGLVLETDMGDGRLRYHSVNKGSRHYLVCRKCGKITDLSEDMVREQEQSILKKYGFAADFKNLVIYGQCQKCGDSA